MTTMPTWSISVSCVREELYAELYRAANAAIEDYVPSLIAELGNDPVKIATVGDIALYQARAAVAAAMSLAASTTSEGGRVEVRMSGWPSYQHEGHDTVTIVVHNVALDGSDSPTEPNEEVNNEAQTANIEVADAPATSNDESSDGGTSSQS